MKRQKKRKRSKRQKSGSTAKKLIRVQDHKKKIFIEKFIYSDPNLTIKELAKEMSIYWETVRDITQEFQFFRWNPLYSLEDTPRSDIRFYFPSIEQFYDLPDLDLCIRLSDQKPHTTKAKRNKLIRAFDNHMGESDIELSERLFLNKNSIRPFRIEFMNTIETESNKEILKFGESCGLHQLTEYVGTVQALCKTYFYMLNPILNIESVKFAKYGTYDRSSPLFLLECLAKEIRMRSQAERAYKKGQISKMDYSLNETINTLKQSIRFSTICNVRHVYKTLGFL